MVSVIVVELANLSCSCNHCVNETQIERQRTPSSELILFWSHVTKPDQGLFLSPPQGWVEESPGNEVVCRLLCQTISQLSFVLETAIMS